MTVKNQLFQLRPSPRRLPPPLPLSALRRFSVSTICCRPIFRSDIFLLTRMIREARGIFTVSPSRVSSLARPPSPSRLGPRCSSLFPHRFFNRSGPSRLLEECSPLDLFYPFPPLKRDFTLRHVFFPLSPPFSFFLSLINPPVPILD